MMVSGFMAFAHGIFLPFNTLFQDNTVFENQPSKNSKTTKKPGKTQKWLDVAFELSFRFCRFFAIFLGWSASKFRFL